MENRQIENSKKEIQKILEDYQNKLKAWENVKFLTKKDGKPFANLSQNFENCSVSREQYSLKSQEKKITVYFDGSRDELSNIEIIRYSKLKPSEDRIIKEPYLEPYFVLTVDEIKNKIEDRKKQIREQIEQYENMLKNFDETVAKLQELLQPACDFLNSLKDNGVSNYYFRKIAEEQVKWCF